MTPPSCGFVFPSKNTAQISHSPSESYVQCLTVVSHFSVGAGTSGAALAAKLAKIGTVLLLEAGPDDHKFQLAIPAASKHLQRTELDWQYRTVPQKHTNNRVHYWPSGKVLGGSSSLGYLLAVRGKPADYDRWEKEFNCTGWGWNDVLPYFKRLEDYYSGTGDHRGLGGPLPVGKLPTPTKLTEYFINSSVAAGLPFLDDYNGPEVVGVSHVQATMRDGKRMGTAQTYLREEMNNPNLTMRTMSQVGKILFNEHKRAYGISIASPTGLDEILAKKEIIVSAGTVGSAQLLLLSGVGPCAELAELGIECVFDSPVGKNLQDHLLVVEAFGILHSMGLSKANETLSSFLKWLLFRSGPSASNTLEAVAYFKSNESLGFPDLQFIFVPVSKDADVSANFGLKHDYTSPDEGLSFLPTLINPKSVGEIKLATANPLDHPIIDPHYLEHEDDLNRLVFAMKLSRTVAKLPPLRHVANWTSYPHRVPEIDRSLDQDSDEYLKQLIRRKIFTSYHPVGTCKMGAADDPTAVVDPSLQVRGVTGLRVVDSSIMPAIPSAATYIPTVMIAEKAFDLIQQKRQMEEPSVKP